MRLAQRSAPSSSVSRSASAAARVSFQSEASRSGSPAASSTTRPCCWPATEMAPTSPARPVSASASRTADHQPRGSDSRAPSVPVTTCGACPRATTSPVSGSTSRILVDWVEQSTPATSRPPVTCVPSASRLERVPKPRHKVAHERGPDEDAVAGLRVVGHVPQDDVGAGEQRLGAGADRQRRARGPARSRRRGARGRPGPRSRCRPGSRRRRRSSGTRRRRPRGGRPRSRRRHSDGAPSRATTSHSSGPSHRTWPWPSVAAVTVFGVVGGVAASASPIRASRLGVGRVGPERDLGHGSQLTDDGLDRRRHAAGSPSRRRFSGSNSTDPAIAASTTRSASGARTRSPIRSRPPFDERQRERPPERGAPIRRGHVPEHRDRDASRGRHRAPPAGRPRGAARRGRPAAARRAACGPAAGCPAVAASGAR